MFSFDPCPGRMKVLHRKKRVAAKGSPPIVADYPPSAPEDHSHECQDDQDSDGFTDNPIPKRRMLTTEPGPQEPGWILYRCYTYLRFLEFSLVWLLVLFTFFDWVATGGVSLIPRPPTARWAVPEASPQCLGYGTRKWSARLDYVAPGVDSLVACYQTKILIHGQKLLPDFCERVSL